MSHRSFAVRRVLLRCASLGLAIPLAASVVACSSSVTSPSDEATSVEKSALTGTITFASSCTTAPSPQTSPPADPAIVMRHLKVSEAYARIAANSPAFRECMQTVMASATPVGLPGNTSVEGPYYACDGDPTPANVDGVLANLLSPDGTVISCDYAAIGTSRGGSAGVGSDRNGGGESINFGNELGAMTTPGSCAYDPDGTACLGDDFYAGTAATIAHEIMHTHGYNHVSDAVWALNDVNVGDRNADGHTFVLDDFCGIQPDVTPGNHGVAPSAPTNNPSPGVHPVYNSSVPYEVGACLGTVLGWSARTGHMHDCGPDFAGLKLVDSVMHGAPETATSSCVQDPYSGAGAAPLPPRAPTGCVLTPPAQWGGAPTLACDPNPNPVGLQRRAVGTSVWTSDVTEYDSGYEYRACASSIYGDACAAPLVVTDCPTAVNMDTKDGVTSFSWTSAPGADHYTIVRNDGASPGPVSFPPLGTVIPGSHIGESIPYDGNATESYSVCAYGNAEGTAGLKSCCSPAKRPTQTSCTTTVKCRVHGKEVIPTDTDDPDTWCSSIGGQIVRHTICSTKQP